MQNKKNGVFKSTPAGNAGARITNNSWNPGAPNQVDNTAWLIDNPDFDEKPATMEQFLGPGYLDIDRTQNPNLPKGVGVRPGVKQALIDIFGDDINPQCISVARRAMFTGGIGVGKSTLASIALSYMVHWVSCLHDPQSFFELLPGSRIAFMLMSTKDSQAKEVLFGDIKALVNGSEWFKKNALPNSGKGESTIKNQLKFPKDIWLLPGNSQETTFEGYNILGGVIDEGDSHKQTDEKDYAAAGWDCADDKTEILSKRGWLNQAELIEGDEVLTLNHETGMSEWNVVEEVRRFNVENAPMISWEGKEFSALTTTNHRWPVIHGKWGTRQWTTSDSLEYKHRVITAAPNADIPTEPKYTDALVELVAWAYTEGSIKDDGRLSIYQDMGTMGYLRIKDAMNKVFGDSWHEYKYKNRSLVSFSLDWEQSLEIRAHLDETKAPKIRFITELTKSQLELFIETSLLADNCGENKLAQKNHRSSEAFALAAILLGKTVSIRPKKDEWKRKQNRKEHYDMLLARILKKDSVPIKELAGNSKSSFKEEIVYYTGTIWCPKTANKSWFARRNGSVYYTGNTIHGRIGSRFTDPINGKHRGLLMAIGQMKKQDGFMARKKKELLKDDDAVVVTMTIWESRGWDYYRDPKTGKVKTFYYDISRRQIVPPLAAQAVKSESIIEIPVAYQKDFENDPVKALRDHAGIPPAVEDPFIAATDRVDEAQDKWQERYADLKYTVDSDTTNPSFHPDFFATDSIKRAIHVDIAYAAHGDAMGMCMGHINEIVEVDGEIKPYIVIDFLLRIKPSGGQQLMLSDFRQIIYHLRDDLGFKIGVVTFDGFQSMDSIQILQKKKFNTAELSVDRKKGPYEDLRQAIYERRIEFPRYMTYVNKGDADKVNIIKKELLELTDVGLKIDHPPNGSKDVADALAGVVHVLMGNNTYRRGAMRGGRNIPTMEDDQDLSKIAVAQPISKDITEQIATPYDPFSQGPINPSKVKELGLPPIERDPFQRLRF